jgi:hypothetical protein
MRRQTHDTSMMSRHYNLGSQQGQTSGRTGVAAAALASAHTAATDGSVSLVWGAHDDDPSRVVTVAGTERGRPRMALDVEVVIVAMMTLMVLLLVVWAEAMWRRRGRRAMADEHMPTSRTDLVTAVIHHARRYTIGHQLSGTQGLEHAQRLPRSPAAGVARGIITIVAVYRTDPVMVVGETAEGALLERSLHELADRHKLLPPRLWQALVEQYQVFQIR